MNENTNEIMLILQEECAEVIQAVSKCMRFGFDNHKPGIETVSNRKALEQELGDVKAMIDLLVGSNIGITENGIEECKKLKFKKLKEFSNIKV